MSYNDLYWEDRGHCPICGKFVGQIRALLYEEASRMVVTGVCKTHGKQDISHQGWDWDEFDKEEGDNH